MSDGLFTEARKAAKGLVSLHEASELAEATEKAFLFDRWILVGVDGTLTR